MDFQPYEQRIHELSVEDGCVLWGSRVVVPLAGREAVIRLLHEGHPGISRMKALARGVVWWPGLDFQLDGKVKESVACVSFHYDVVLERASHLPILMDLLIFVCLWVNVTLTTYYVNNLNGLRNMLP